MPSAWEKEQHDTCIYIVLGNACFPIQRTASHTGWFNYFPPPYTQPPFLCVCLCISRITQQFNVVDAFKWNFVDIYRGSCPGRSDLILRDIDQGMWWWSAQYGGLHLPRVLFSSWIARLCTFCCKWHVDISSTKFSINQNREVSFNSSG